MVSCCNTINKIRDVRYWKRKVFVIKCMFGILSMGKKLILEICKKFKKKNILTHQVCCVGAGGALGQTQQLLLQSAGQEEQLHGVLVISLLHKGLEGSFHCRLLVTG